MSGFVVEDRSGIRILTITVPGIVVRLVAVAPVVAALVAVHRAAPGTPWWPSAVLVLLAVVSAELPDSGAGLVTLGGLVGWWLVAVPDPSVEWALVVAAGGLVFHLTLAYAAAGPPGCTPSPAVVGRLVLRCGALLLATAGLALVVAVAEEWGEPPALVVGVTLVLAGVLPWLAIRRGG